MNNTVSDVGNYLKEHGVKPSYQRMKIFQYLLENRCHPTVDTIYKALCTEIPTLSKTTVYNTLNLFMEKNLVNVVVIEENETRYDVDTTIHGHFKCEKCGCIHDIDLNLKDISSDKLGGFQIKEHHHYFKGICKDCLNK